MSFLPPTAHMIRLRWGVFRCFSGLAGACFSLLFSSSVLVIFAASMLEGYAKVFSVIYGTTHKNQEYIHLLEGESCRYPIKRLDLCRPKGQAAISRNATEGCLGQNLSSTLLLILRA